MAKQFYVAVCVAILFCVCSIVVAAEHVPPAIVRAHIDDEGVVRIPIECEDMQGVQWGPEGFTPVWTAGRWGRDTHQNMIFGSAWASRMATAVTDASDDPSAVRQDIQVPRTGKYKIWARYECPPFFNYPFGMDIEKLGADGAAGKAVYEKVCGLRAAAKHFSFKKELLKSDLYWAWGIDHDAAEGYEADLQEGTYRVTLYKAPLPDGYRGPVDAGGLPAQERIGARSVDAILITSRISDMAAPDQTEKRNWEMSFPLLPELQRANHLYIRFRNTGDEPIVVTYDHWNHRNAHIFYRMTGWSRPLVRFYDADGEVITDEAGAPLSSNNAQWAKPIAPGKSSPWIDIGPTMNPESSCPFSASARPANTRGRPARNAPSPPFAMDIAVAPSEREIVKSFPRVEGEPMISLLIQPDIHRPDGLEWTMSLSDVYRRAIKALEAEPRIGPIPRRLRLYGVTSAPLPGASGRPGRPGWPLAQDYGIALGLNTMPTGTSDGSLPAVDGAVAYCADKDVPLIQLSGREFHIWGARSDVPAKSYTTDRAKSLLHAISYGDEIHLPRLEVNDPDVIAEFRAFLEARGVTARDLGVDSEEKIVPLAAYTAAEAVRAGLLPEPKDGAAAVLPDGPAARPVKRLYWWSHEFKIHKGIAGYVRRTEEFTELIGPHVKTTANLGGMHPFYWMSQATFIEAFRHKGMTLAWSEDYDYCMPEVSRLVVDFEAAYLRAGAKYHDTPMMFYCMPHYPGNTGQHLVQNAVTLWGQGIKDFDFFFVSPDGYATENYITTRGGIEETGLGIRRISGLAGNIEDALLPARTRPARVAILLSEASDVWEIEGQPNQWGVAPGTKATNVSQEERKNIWYCLRNHGYLVDLLTENDVAEGRLKDYAVLYVCGLNLDRRAVTPIREWVNAGGSLFLTAGAARKDQYDEPLSDLDALVGRGRIEKATIYRGPLRAKLELLQLRPLDTLTLMPSPSWVPMRLDAFASQEVFLPAAGAQVLGRFGHAAGPAMVRAVVGKGAGYYIGALPGQAYVRKGLMPPRPMGKGGPESNYSQIEPVELDHNAASAILMPQSFRDFQPEVKASHRGVVANILESDDATLVTLVNLARQADGPARDLKVTLRAVRPAKNVSTATKRDAVFANQDNGVTVELTLLDDADVVVLEH